MTNFYGTSQVRDHTVYLALSDKRVPGRFQNGYRFVYS